ncbi:MAG: hypothetical protein M3Y81_09130 [Chloroflexota bacterium]|nr:hypothetical protein [Chloroflexota bacterium]
MKVGVILLLMLLVLAAAGYVVVKYIGSRSVSQANASLGIMSTSTVAPSAPVTTTLINSTVIYASVNITIVNAQQATSFADDHSTPAQGVVRLNLHAVQSDVNNVGTTYFTTSSAYAYPEAFALLLPGGKKVAMGSYKDLSGPPQKGNQTTWIDFPASTGLKVSQMTLHIGKDAEEQIQVPLTGHADLSQYQSRQSTLHLRVPFGSTFWTLKTVTLKLSDSGAQVTKGIRFLVLRFSVDDPSTNGGNAYPPDYMRLQYGGTIITLEQVALGDVAPHTTNVPGIVSFLVPQGTTAATFILLPGHTPGATSQATIPFQIP